MRQGYYVAYWCWAAFGCPWTPLLYLQSVDKAMDNWMWSNFPAFQSWITIDSGIIQVRILIVDFDHDSVVFTWPEFTSQCSCSLHIPSRISQYRCTSLTTTNLPLSASNRNTREHIRHYESPGKEIGIGRPNLLTLYTQTVLPARVAKEERARKFGLWDLAWRRYSPESEDKERIERLVITRSSLLHRSILLGTMHLDFTSMLVSWLPVPSRSYGVLSIELQYAPKLWTMSFHINWVLQIHLMTSFPSCERASDIKQSRQWAHYELSNAFIQHATSSRTQTWIEWFSGRPKAYRCHRHISSIRINYGDYRSTLDSATQVLLNPFVSFIRKAE